MLKRDRWRRGVGHVEHDMGRPRKQHSDRLVQLIKSRYSGRTSNEEASTISMAPMIRAGRRTERQTNRLGGEDEDFGLPRLLVAEKSITIRR